MIITTLKALRENGACCEGYNKVVRKLQGEEFTEEDEDRSSYIHFSHQEGIPLSLILENNGLDDALWALRACEQTPELQRAERLFAVWCARQVQHLMTDRRSINALDVSERFANGNATSEELAAARGDAWDAASASVWDAARSPAGAAAGAAAGSAWATARSAAWATAGATAMATQKQKFIEVFCGEDAPNIDCLCNAKSGVV